MQTFLADQDITLVVPLRIGGEPFIPDAGSVTWTLRDAVGQVVDGFADQPVTMATGATEAAVVVPAAQNSLGAGRFSKRAVVVKATKTLRPLQFTQFYRLCGWINTTVTPDEVRSYVGVDEGELPDDAIDIPAAYFDVEDQTTEAELSDALASAGKNERAANAAILAQAVLNLIPSLPLRLSQSESNGLFTSARPKIDISDLEERAQLLLADNLSAFTARFESDADILIAVTLSPDPWTGA